jgi:hypothetical protein
MAGTEYSGEPGVRADAAFDAISCLGEEDGFVAIGMIFK